jgi:anthranilate synthase component 1
MNIKIKTNYLKTFSDTHTPVELYLKLRDKYPYCFLLESSDYKSKENSFSYICFFPIASFKVNKEKTEIQKPKETKKLKTQEINVSEELYSFVKSFEIEKLPFDFVTNGLFGYTSYDAIPFFEEINFKKQDFHLPLIQYHVFKFIIIFNHFNSELYLVENLLEGEKSQMKELREMIERRAITQFEFKVIGNENSNFSDDEFLEVIKKGKEHCKLGNVFQVVLSRRYQMGFRGDDFNVYRALRSINPSPYLFYFDYGNFRILGSSPEAQLTISQNKAIICPIAGTFQRSGDSKEDEKISQNLLKDIKETSEHTMLVDLARNDLSKFSKNVKVESFQQVEYYSHVIHLVSKVSGELEEGYNSIKILGGTYPAGTLSGAPKHKALQIIDENEPNSRGLYGGTVGYMGFHGELNHAIFIRSFLSYQNQLIYQAGCGVVAKSEPEKELQEVNNKLKALRKAIQLAQFI